MLTGFLGAGETTVLNNVLSDKTTPDAWRRSSSMSSAKQVWMMI
ncbi:MAG: hypothetical protein AAGG57_06265 [Pseudomonadota bacterium]